MAGSAEASPDEVLRLRADGLTYAQIAGELGFATPAAAAAAGLRVPSKGSSKSIVKIKSDKLEKSKALRVAVQVGEGGEGSGGEG